MRNLTLCDDGTNALCAEEDPKGLAGLVLIGMNFLGTTARTSISMIDLDPSQKHRDLLPLISVGRGTGAGVVHSRNSSQELEES